MNSNIQVLIGEPANIHCLPLCSIYYQCRFRGNKFVMGSFVNINHFYSLFSELQFFKEFLEVMTSVFSSLSLI